MALGNLIFQNHPYIHRLKPTINNVCLVKIEGPVWYTIYHPLPVVEGLNKPLY